MRSIPPTTALTQPQQTPLLDLLADLPPFQFLDALNDEFKTPDIAFEKGTFKRIVARQIDLPRHKNPPRNEDSNLWIQRLPLENRNHFIAEQNNPFTRSIRNFAEKAKTDNSLVLLAPKTHATVDQYASLLDRAEHSGMLHWEIGAQKDPSQAVLCDEIQMTLFAVSKSESRSRLISWPRVQNVAMSDPPHTPLPDPTLFDAINVEGDRVSAFYFDI